MKEVFICYKTDVWHSYASRDLIGVATSKEEAVNICQLQAKHENSEISKDELFNLGNINQTQGYEGEGEFVIEPVDTNTIL